MIVLYNNDAVANQNNRLWPRNRFLHSPWANTDKYESLIPYLEQKLAQRPIDLQNATFFVTQGILTEKAKDILEHLFGQTAYGHFIVDHLLELPWVASIISFQFCQRMSKYCENSKEDIYDFSGLIHHERW